MNTLTIVMGYNSTGKQDATGAFLPEARAFRKLHGGVTRVDGYNAPGGGWLEFTSPTTPAKRREWTEVSIRSALGLEVLAIFGHGTAQRLIATGHGWQNVNALACELVNSTFTPLTVILYACSTARGNQGFADLLANALPFANVWAHTSAGHTTWNPNTELAGGPNFGDPIAKPGDPLWKRWRERMRDDQEFRLSFWKPAHGLSRNAALEAVRESI